MRTEDARGPHIAVSLLYVALVLLGLWSVFGGFALGGFSSSADVVIAGFAVAEQVAWRMAPPRTSAFDAQVAEATRSIRAAGLGPDDVFFLYPAGFSSGSEIEEREVWRTHMVAMWASLATGVPTANGYSARAPLQYPAEREMPPPEAIRAWLGAYHAHRCVFLRSQ